jgi:hypothetical protein
LWALVAVLVVAGLLLVVAFIYFDPPPGSNCLDWYFYCPRGPSATTPLGVAFAFGGVSSINVVAGGPAQPGCGTPERGMEYCEVIAIHEASIGLATNSIGFQLNYNGGPVVAYSSLTLFDRDGRGIAQITPTGDWVRCSPSSCGVATSSTSPPVTLTTNMTLVLDGGSSANFPSGLKGYGFTALGRGVFAGTVGPLALR